MSRTYVILLTVCAALLVPTATRAQSSTLLEQAVTAFEELDYPVARRALSAFIAEPARATTSELANAHMLLGIIEFSEGVEAAARLQFTSALQLRPGIRPDPSSVSPKIIDYFDQVRSSLVSQPIAVETRYVTIADQRPAAALRSMVLPGWGQLHKGQRGKAAVAGGAWFATAGATAVAHGVRRRARQRYVDETDPALVSDRYDSFNRAHKARNTLALSAAIVWLASYVDALATPGKRIIAPVQVTVVPQYGGASFTARLNF